jgi:DNA-binding IclR family transcriptional regulator
MASDDGPKRLSTIQNTFTIVESVQELGGARVSEVANHLDLAQSTAHSYLKTLEECGYLFKQGDEYHIALKFLDHGGYACHQVQGYDHIQHKVEELAEETGERAQFIAEENGVGYYLTTTTGEHAVDINARIGKPIHLHASAAGKAILANLPQNRLDQFFEEKTLTQETEETIIDRDTLEVELEQIREDGYSFNEEESIPGLNAIAAPVKNPNDGVYGALSIFGPTNRMSGARLRDELPKLLLGAVNELELKIEFS